MNLLAFDPGPELHGWCLLDFGPAEYSIRGRAPMQVRLRRPWFVDGGRVAAKLEDVRVLLDTRPHEYLAIEGHEATIFDKRAAAGPLFETYWKAGQLEALDHVLHMAPQRAIVIPASAWRRELCGSRAPGVQGFRTADARIKAIVQQRVDGLPKVFGAHVADACGLGLVAALRIQTRRVA